MTETAPAGNRTRVCTVAGYYSTTRPLVPSVRVAESQYFLKQINDSRICVLDSSPAKYKNSS